MPKYIYSAKSFDGKLKGGEMEAKDEKSLAQSLRSEGFLVTSMKVIGEKEKKGKVSFLSRFERIPMKDKMVFARNLGVMVSAGLPIAKAIKNLSVQMGNKNFKKILLEINEELQTGKNLSECLRAYPSVFSDLFVNMVRVGEAGGTLEDSLDTVATQLEKEHDIIGKTRGAMMYPMVVIVAMLGIGIVMLTYVLPQMLGVFGEMKVQLPITTLAMIAASNFIIAHYIILSILFIAFLVFLKVFWGMKAGKKFFGFLSIKMPIISNIIIKVNCARFSRIYSSLLKSGVSVIEGLKITSDTLGNYFYKEAINDAIEKVQKGVSLSSIIGSYPKIFPPLVSQMFEVGEETGKIESVLIKLAEFYEAEVDQITKNMSSIIEPVLMVIIGGAVGVFAVSMLQPMYTLMDNIK